MRLVLCYQHVHPDRGGAETYVADLCRALAARGHDVTLMASTCAGGVLGGSLRWQRIPERGPSSLARLWNFAVDCEARLLAERERHDCSIGFINTWGQDILIPQGGVRRASLDANAQRFGHRASRIAYQLAKRANPKSWVYEAIEHRQYDPKRATRVVAVSEMVRSHLMDYRRVEPERICVIYNAIDERRVSIADRPAARARFRSALGARESDVLALFSGHNFRLKGLGPLLEALAICRTNTRRAPRVVVCGGGNPRAFRKQAELLGLVDLVHFAGFVADVRDAYAASDFFVLPTYYDPCSLVVFEALAAGLPVITTRCNGASEVIRQGVEGFVIDKPGATDQLASAMGALCDDAVRTAAAIHARRLAHDHTFDRHVDRLVALADDVARQRRAPYSRHAPRRISTSAGREA